MHLIYIYIYIYIALNNSHNHPSGNLYLSEAGIEITQKLKEANIEHLDFAKLRTQETTSLEKRLMGYGFIHMNEE